MPPSPRSHGTGAWRREQLASCPDSVVIEDGVLIFHPEHVFLAEDVYVGHQAILKGYYKNELRVGRGTWIGQGVFFHAAGGITIGERVGIGPRVMILTSAHQLADEPSYPGKRIPILDRPLTFAPVRLDDGCDIGVGAILLPGITVGKFAQVGAGAVVTRDVAPGAIVAGNPARELRRL